MHDVEGMPDKLARFLSERDGARSATVVSYEAMVGGYSRLMAKADIQWSNGERDTFVLRGDPLPGKALIETSRDAEYQLLRALTEAATIAMPAVRHYDSTGDALGTKCIVLDFVAGSSLQAMLHGAQGDDDIQRHAADLVDTLARVHTIDTDVVAGTLPIPTDWDAYLSGLIQRFRDADSAHAEAVPFLRYVASWLDAHRPPPLPLRIVHSDFQPANIMVTPDGEHLMIDWELAHVGDPREDLGYYNVYSSALGPNLFMADPEGFLARYRERTGFGEDAVNMETMGYFSSLAAITVYAQILAGLGAMARGQNSGLMTTYNMNALSIGHMNFLAGCAAPAPPPDNLHETQNETEPV